ncbi:hypothetical protein [Yeosuana marina]|uniref:hypothetical protein n=1 Tax=Yeosuana marina TaxID=1565536 RepID=UPI0030EDFB14|tara:strand:- start:512 stop:724 length:213 start_codon:yes stop_codon:yes gene_type:complete
MDQLIIEVIEKQNVIEFFYKGNLRVVEAYREAIDGCKFIRLRVQKQNQMAFIKLLKHILLVGWECEARNN